MNIFVTDTNPIQSAANLPDKHIVKMPLETCQMLAIIYSDWYYGVGKLYKSDGYAYRTQHGAFRNHPCTQWAAANQYNLSWLIVHGFALCTEYTERYGKIHSCYDTICQAADIYNKCFDDSWSSAYHHVTDFTRAMPDYIKSDFTITTTTAYQRYLNTKPWVATNYLRIPTRKPYFITTMTTSTPKKSDLPVYDFSQAPDPKGLAEFNAKKALEKAIDNAKITNIKPAPAAKGLVPAPKTSAKTKGKAGRIVGISADENKYIQQVLQMIADDSELGSSNPNYVKIQARYNK